MCFGLVVGTARRLDVAGDRYLLQRAPRSVHHYVLSPRASPPEASVYEFLRPKVQVAPVDITADQIAQLDCVTYENSGKQIVNGAEMKFYFQFCKDKPTA